MTYYGNEIDDELDDLANDLYIAYCKAVGGKAFNGDVLPSWQEFRNDESKKKQSDAWIKVAETAKDLLI